jgi:hypothetical protein
VIELASVLLGDTTDLWAELGFTVDDGSCAVSGVRFVLDGGEPGVCGWTFRGLRPVGDLDGAPIRGPVDKEALPSPRHPNGVFGLDHVVLATPDLDRTLAVLHEHGFDLRRTREGESMGRQVRQAFFRLGPVVLEVVAPAERAGDGPATVWGLAFTGDLDVLADTLGDRLGPARDAVQPGRRIASLAPTAGSTVPIAFLSERRVRTTA